MSMPVISLVLIFVAAVNLTYAGAIFSQHKNSKLHQFFATTISFNVLWTLGAFFLLSLDSSELALSWSRLFFIAPMLTAYFLILFAFSFPKNIKPPLLPSVLLLVPILLLGGLIFFDASFLIESMNTQNRINEFTVNQNVFLLYGLFFVVYFSISYFIFLFRSMKATGSTKTQINYVLLSAFSSSALALFTNIVLVYTGTSKYIWLGPVFTIFYVVVSSYAIAKHQLFDIRTAIARSVAYALSLGTMLVVYVVLIFGATGLFIDNSTVDNTQKVIYAVFAVLIAFTFQPLKNFFDKLTDKIFYRDKYDSEQLLSDYTDFLVDEIDTDKVVNETLTLMNEIVNPTTSIVVLYRDGVGVWRDLGGPIDGNEKSELAKALEYQSAPIFIAESISNKQDPFLENIKNHMLKNDLSVSIRLSTHGQLEGFILLGDKKSGTRYTQKDLNFFVTIANELSVSIQNSQRFDQIQRFNVTLQREVEEATARLKQTNEKLKQLDVAKDEFISMASHQLRTPLTSVKGYLSMVMDGDAGKINKEQTKLLSEAFSSSQRMVYLIADLLNVSRLKTGKFVIEPARVDLPVVVQEEVDQLTPTASTRQILIKYSKPSSFPEMFIDETKTRQVIMNFIDNAIYYTQGGGEIKVTLMAKKDHIEYRVIDSGIGIPTVEQHKLFTKFFRASNAKRARPDGTGLGLYMAQKIISAQDGSVTFKSTEGKGSTFGFNLPIKPIETTDTDRE